MEFLPFINGSKVYMSAAPLQKNIDAFINDLKRLNITDIIVLLTDKEMITLYGSKEYYFYCYEEQGITPHHSPIQDFSVPTNIGMFDRFISMMIRLLKNKRNILVHCHGGHGRTGIVTCSLVIRCGKTAKEAYSYVSSKRPIIDTNEQFDFLDDYEKYINDINRETND